jgi:hypothetical protein
MFGSTILDVAIGLIFIYFLLSMITSHINELISQMFSWRSKDLEAGIRTMLADPNLANKVWNHPMIRGLSVRVGRNPSYIPPNTFALALFDALVPVGQNPTVLENIRVQALNLPDTSARNIVISMIDHANGDMNQARGNIEQWFNDTMDRVSGVYKQRILWVTILVSLLVTFLFGVDTITLSNSLWIEPGLRAALTGAGTSFAGSDVSGGTSLQDAVKTLNQFTLPIGWTAFPTDVASLVKKILGLLLTTFAVSLGAPFWFDVLKKVVNLRGAGPAPQTASAATQPSK